MMSGRIPIEDTIMVNGRSKDHVYASNTVFEVEKREANSKTENINKLKSVIYLRLQEVIKDQADQLLAKDKQIAKLQTENEELRRKCEASPSKVKRSRTPRKANGVQRRTKRKMLREAEKAGEALEGVESEPKQDKPEVSDLASVAFMTSEKSYMSCEWKASEPARPPSALLEIPMWSEREAQTCYSVEGTENLTDEAFAKRHTKYEVNEKRRKRWDVQRLREVRTVEKLKLKYMREELEEERVRNKNRRPAISSFYPPPESLKFIQIVDRIPVLAFGESVPELPPQEFTLPWHSSSHTDLSPSTSITKTRFFKK